MKNYEFKDFNEHKKEIKKENLEILNEVPIFYYAKIGKGEILIKDLKNAKQGTMIPLNVSEGEKFSLCTKDEKELFKGTIVVMDGELYFKVEN